jgi:hypothetical protein
LQAVEQAHVAQYARAVRYDRGVNESFVDLTYRGLSLGRRSRLTQVRPSTGYVELAAPMPVGTPIAIASDDGTGFEATVIEIHEQITGSERPPGMTVAPALGTEAAEAWWRARVTLDEDGGARPRTTTAGGRTRPPTVRPRSHTAPAPPASPGRAAGAETAAIAADLDARVAAAAGVAPRSDGDRSEMRTLVMPLHEVEALAAATGSEPDPATTLQMRQVTDHDVADDGSRTTIMDSVDPAMLGGEAAHIGDGDADGEFDGAGDDGDDAAEPEAGEPGGGGASGDASKDTLEDSPSPVSRGRRRRRRSRR